jgi:predicted O-methyltransferase YrrM
MSKDQWSAVDQYFTDLLVRPDEALDAALQASDAAGLPTIAVAPNIGKLLHLLARATGARRILEIGTLGGYSTIWLARALPEDGRLITLDFDPNCCNAGGLMLDEAAARAGRRPGAVFPGLRNRLLYQRVQFAGGNPVSFR